ncbi:hypothetical protein [Halalkalibacter alkalisediminis]|uniref:hypothetical protein n=1 Tax=Halalkalibacter alkalisediminis TaxID=935616 RepID=UPI00236097F9|nr:hypothetical protein [Halalkalibacter alkalisediminis]
MNRKVIKQKYGRLLENSDLFGLPVWSIMTEETSQEVMPIVKEDLDKNIPPYRISDLEEILNYISDQSGGITSLSDGDKKHIELLVDTFKKILHRHERWSKEWRVLLSLNQEQIKEQNNYYWICNLLFTYNNEIIYRGTLRFYKKSLTHFSHLPPDTKDSFITSWFFIKKMIPSADKPRLILSIVDDISTEIFTSQQPHISINTENDSEMLFSWNSSFEKKVISIPDLSSNFRARMRDLNAVSSLKVFNMNGYFYSNDLDWTRSEENNSNDEQTFKGTRIYNTFDYLLKNCYIKNGDYILFKNGEDPSCYEFAEIIIPKKKAMLLWKGDIYHFTNLTKKLLNNQFIETTPNYCAKFWYLPNRQYSLYELANFIKMFHKF